MFSRRGDVVAATPSPAQSQRISSVMQWPLHLCCQPHISCCRSGLVSTIRTPYVNAKSINQPRFTCTYTKPTTNKPTSPFAIITVIRSILTHLSLQALAEQRWPPHVLYKSCLFQLSSPASTPCLSKAIHSSTTDLLFFSSSVPPHGGISMCKMALSGSWPNEYPPTISQINCHRNRSRP